MIALSSAPYVEYLEQDFAKMFKNNCQNQGYFTDEVLDIGIKFGFMRRVEHRGEHYIGIDFYKWSQVTAHLRTNLNDRCFL